MKTVGIFGIAALLLVPYVFSGCRAQPEEEPVTGKNEHHQDDVPDTIASKEIISLDTSFCVLTRWNTEESSFFHFAIEEDETGVLQAAEKNLGIQYPADEALLKQLQEVIDRENLVSQNGLYDVTAGLAPEYQPCSFSAVYASGEKLYFRQDNNPYALWSESFYDLFAAWFSSHGIESLYPRPDDSLITRFDFGFRENGSAEDFFDVNVSGEEAFGGKTHLLRRDTEDPEHDAQTEYAAVPEDYYQKVTRIIADHDIQRRCDFSEYNHASGSYDNHELGYYGFGDQTAADGEPDAEGLYLEIYIEYESGRIIHIETGKSSEIDAVRDLILELSDYHHSLFTQ